MAYAASWPRGVPTRLPDPEFHFLTPEYPPAKGGVADYTRLVASALARTHGTVHVWAPSVPGTESVERGVIVHRIADFGRRSLEEISEGLAACPGPRRLFVQYVPTAFGWRGMNVPLVRWLVARQEELWIQFHEVALGWKLWRKPHLHLVHGVERWMAAALSKRANRIFISIEAWRRRLGGDAGRAVWLPIPSNLPVTVEPAALAHARERLGGGTWVSHFGTYSPLIRADLRGALRALAGQRLDIRFLLLGRGASAFAATLGIGARVRAFEDLPASDLAALLKASAVAIQPFPDGISARRTSAMAALALGVPVVTTDGFLTDPVWREGAVALAPVGRPVELAEKCLAVLADEDWACSLGDSGARLYRERFSIERTLETLGVAPGARVG